MKKQILYLVIMLSVLLCVCPRSFAEKVQVLQFDFENFAENNNATLAPDGFTIQNAPGFSVPDAEGAGVLSANTDKGTSLCFVASGSHSPSLVSDNIFGKHKSACTSFFVSFSGESFKRSISLEGKSYQYSNSVKREYIKVSDDNQLIFMDKASGIYFQNDTWYEFRLSYDCTLKAAECSLFKDGEALFSVRDYSDLYIVNNLIFAIDASTGKSGSSMMYIDDIKIESLSDFTNLYSAPSLFARQTEHGIFELSTPYNDLGSLKMWFDIKFDDFSTETHFCVQDLSNENHTLFWVDTNGKLYDANNKYTGFVFEKDKTYRACMIYCPGAGCGNISGADERDLCFSENFTSPNKISSVSGFSFLNESDGVIVSDEINLTTSQPYYIPGGLCENFSVAMSIPENGNILKEMPSEAIVVFNTPVKFLSFNNKTVFINGRGVSEDKISFLDTYTAVIDISDYSDVNVRIDFRGTESQYGKKAYQTVKFGKYYTAESLGFFKDGEEGLLDIDKLEPARLAEKTKISLAK